MDSPVHILGLLKSHIVYISLYLSILFHLSGAGSRWQQDKEGVPDVRLPSKVFQLLQADPEAFPGQVSYIIPPACSGSALGSPTSWTCLENLQGKMWTWPIKLTPSSHHTSQVTRHNWLLVPGAYSKPAGTTFSISAPSLERPTCWYETWTHTGFIIKSNQTSF